MTDGNKITNWSWDAPTEPGLYLICFGDVEVKESISFLNTSISDGELVYFDEHLDSVRSINNISKSYKWARLLVGSEARE